MKTKLSDFFKTSPVVKPFVQIIKQNSMMILELSSAFLIFALRQKTCQDLIFMLSSVDLAMLGRCPLLFDVVDTLLLHKADGRDVSERRVQSAVHSLAILINSLNKSINYR